MSARLQLLGLALLALPPAAPGQWRVGVDAGIASFVGTSRDTAGITQNGRYRPLVPAVFGVRIERRAGTVTVGLGVMYATPALALQTDGPSAFVPGSMLHVQAAPEIAATVLTLGTGAALGVHAGPLVEVWTVENEDPRWRVGGQAGLALECPLAARLAAAVTARLGVTPSIFEPGELPPEFERRASWRTSVALGVRYTL